MNFNLEYKKTIRSKTLETNKSYSKSIKKADHDNSYIHQEFKASSSEIDGKAAIDSMIENITDSRIEKSPRDSIVRDEPIDPTKKVRADKFAVKKSDELYDEIFALKKDMNQ